MNGAVAECGVDVVGAGCEVCGEGAGGEPAAALLRGQETCACSQPETCVSALACHQKNRMSRCHALPVFC